MAASRVTGLFVNGELDSLVYGVGRRSLDTRSARRRAHAGAPYRRDVGRCHRLACPRSSTPPCSLRVGGMRLAWRVSEKVIRWPAGGQAAGYGQVDDRLSGGRQELVVLAEPAVTTQARKCPLQHPPSWGDREPWDGRRLLPWRQLSLPPSTIGTGHYLEGDLGHDNRLGQGPTTEPPSAPYRSRGRWRRSSRRNSSAVPSRSLYQRGSRAWPTAARGCRPAGGACGR
jgi:hypothetical protein